MVAVRRKRGFVLLCGFLLLLLTFILVAFGNLNPIAARMAQARVRQYAIEALNNAVDEVLASGIRYADLVRVTTDNEGQVSMLQANTLVMNELAGKAASAAQRNLRALSREGVDVPLGAALGITLVSGVGPRYRVVVEPVGSVMTQFVTAFESAGINQTRHEISLEAAALMKIVIPTGADSFTVTATIPVAESIIVGRVPDTFVNVPDTESMLNLLP